MDDAVAVLGAGNIGAGVAAACALAGLRVTTLSRHPDAARHAVGRILADAKRHRLADPAAADRAGEALSCVDTAAGVPRGVSLVLENLPESLEVKAEVLTSVLGRLTGDAVVATNTSSLPISVIGSRIAAETMTAGLHFMNPALLMPLVELIPGDRTAAAALDRCEQLALRLGKRVIHVSRDCPGFVWNRLQFTMLREAVQLVSDGVVSAADVDAAVELGLARRWQYAGPLTTARLGGVDTFRVAARNLLPVSSIRQELDNLDEVLPSPGEAARALATRQEGLARLLREDLRHQPDHR